MGAIPAPASAGQVGLLHMAQRCSLRWAVDIARWKPSPSELAFLLSLLPEHEQVEATRFKFEADRKRHLVSRLLGRAAASAALSLRHSEVLIKRTRGGKPYVANELAPGQKPVGAANYNYSISHEVGWLASGARALSAPLNLLTPSRLTAGRLRHPGGRGPLRGWRRCRSASAGRLGPSSRLSARTRAAILLCYAPR